MATLDISPEQIRDLVLQLSPAEQEKIARDIMARHEQRWGDLRAKAWEGARTAAHDRGLSWDSMTDAEREEFIVDRAREARYVLLT